ncbi:MULTISPECIES: hypothetical protein [unclassified Bradyrhizobium]|uniref:hypothetical protein n=1 Tax=unclassified Bradyrhizobium TaxID=2631580 RepID=UPI0024798076|nr:MULTISPECIES: hypothetical protein [unclassified Bradyrhizobium]WGR71318.1 hypothetical protein MTX24_39470 [Bradyrhizobium sp. ISRA426]WGR76153.1 hypothetical protein MTX21_24575 [Bradyrhizobium sp. ISRA430]WGR86558.1 hypothetical protein MTX25_39160 [Bradyrhizobium sp. ISRA432]
MTIADQLSRHRVSKALQQQRIAKNDKLRRILAMFAALLEFAGVSCPNRPRTLRVFILP